MPKCSDNRKASRKRTKKLLRRLVEKRFKTQCFKDNGSPSSDYYSFTVLSVATRQDGPCRLITGFHYRLRPNRRYREMVAELARMCQGVSIPLTEGVPDSLVRQTEGNS